MTATLTYDLTPYSPAMLDEIADLFVRVDASCGIEPWSYQVRDEGLEGARELLDRSWLTAAVTVVDDRIIGFAALAQPAGDRVEIARVMTDPEFQNNGVATNLIMTLVDYAESVGLQVWLETLESATDAIRLYGKLGFQTSGYDLTHISGREMRQMERPRVR